MALIKCEECGNNVSSMAEVCPECGFNVKGQVKGSIPSFNEELNSIKIDQKNTIVTILKVVAWIVLVLGCILGIVLAKDVEDETQIIVMFTTILTYCGVFLGIYVVAEIVDLLHDIRKQLWHIRNK